MRFPSGHLDRIPLGAASERRIPLYFLRKTYLRPDIVPPHVPVHHNYNKNYLIVAFVSFGVAVVVAAAVGVAAVDDVVVDSVVAVGDVVHVGTAEKET